MTPSDQTATRKRRKRVLPKIISPVEATNLLRAVDDGTPEGTRDRLALELMYRAGLRVSEVVKLRPRDVHSEGFIDVYAAKGGDGTSYFDPARINPLIVRWEIVREDWISADGVWPGADIFPFLCKRDGSSLTPRYLQRLIKRLKTEVGILGICTPHVLRHSFATELLEDGFSLVEVQSLLRHANLQTTAVYLHVRDKALMTKMSRRSQREEG